MDKHEAWEANMDTKALDGREAVVEMVREARVAAACVCALLAHVLFV